MTIEIHQPELEAIIEQRMATGRFQSIEDVLMDALGSSQRKPPVDLENATGALLVAAMQRSPYKEIDLTPDRYQMPVRDVEF